MGSITCDGGTFPIVYYAGSNGHQTTEIFGGSTNIHWLFNVNTSQDPSYISVANPDSLVTVPSFFWQSNGKPKNVSEVIAWSTPTGVGVVGNSSIPSNYSRSNPAAELVFHLHRNSWADGFVPRQINYLPVGGSSQSVTEDLASSATSDEVDNECRPIHIAFCGDGIVDNSGLTSSTNINTPLAGGEACDDGNNINGDGCNNDCTVTPPEPGVCGSVDGDDIYDFDNAGDGLNANAPNLCAEGALVNFSYNPTTHEWTWECEGTFGGSNDVCIATELRCGDGIQNGSEQCDDGNTTNGDGCNNDCTTSSPGVCGSVNGSQIYDFDNA